MAVGMDADMVAGMASDMAAGMDYNHDYSIHHYN
jgi:hypothetical protein